MEQQQQKFRDTKNNTDGTDGQKCFVIIESKAGNVKGNTKKWNGTPKCRSLMTK